MRKVILSALILVFILPALVSAVELPENIQKIREYNQQQALMFLQAISIPIALIAGMLSLFSPCILPFIPAFFAYTFKEKRNITKMSSVFFLGFAVVFVAMGLAAAAIGLSLAMIQQNLSIMVMAAGVLLIAFGLMSLFGRGFSSFIKSGKGMGNGTAGVFFMGILFALGWTACIGPILVGILLIAGTLGSFAYAGILLFVYSLGIFIPFLVISLLYDRLNLSRSRFISGKVFSFRVSGRDIRIHSTNLLSGILFVFIGAMFLGGGTGIINSIDPLGMRDYFYILQNQIIGMPFLNYVFLIVILIIASYIIIRRVRK